MKSVFVQRCKRDHNNETFVPTINPDFLRSFYRAWKRTPTYTNKLDKMFRSNRLKLVILKKNLCADPSLDYELQSVGLRYGPTLRWVYSTRKILTWVSLIERTQTLQNYWSVTKFHNTKVATSICEAIRKVTALGWVYFERA